ncbi:ester cyclase [Candidatus Njordibacter sp. Uisw_039]|uniref:ester cyclase n=1 Tax=Candidatus Njordibacter sp. Uisw_039 TaxID=3230972 RepID=UPI003D387319
MSNAADNKVLLAPLLSAMHDFEGHHVKSLLQGLMGDHAVTHLCFPFNDIVGPTHLYETCYAPLLLAMPDLERRDLIVLSGITPAGNEWVGCAGHYLGTFVSPWLDIPPTGHMTHMRFHEFFRFEQGKIVEIQAIWDIPEVMLQAQAWPLSPSLGWEGFIPGPASQDGLRIGDKHPGQGEASVQHVLDMLTHLILHPKQGGPEVMQLQRFWHPRMNWYGPAGIGSSRGITGFRNWHQIPFLNAMPDRGSHDNQLDFHLFGEGEYVAVTGWPNMKQTITQGGWLGIAPSGQEVSLRSLDFWRMDGGLIRENWVLVDLLDLYHQVGIDVFARLGEFNKARNTKSSPHSTTEM